MNRTYLLLIVICVLLSCSRKSDCDRSPLYVRFPTTHFDSAALSDVVFTSYVKETNFTELVHEQHMYFTIKGSAFALDTTSKLAYIDRYKLDTGYDWIVSLPISGKSYKLNNFYYENTRRKNGGIVSEIDRCTSDIYFSVNGVEQNRKGGFERGPEPYDFQ